MSTKKKATPRKSMKMMDEKQLQDELGKKKKSNINLQNEISSFEEKNILLRDQVMRNENLLSIIEEKNRENKEFSQRIQEAIKGGEQVTFDINDPFIKRYFKKLKNLISERNLKEDGSEMNSKRIADGKKKLPRADSLDSADQNKIEQMRLENEFMLRIISKDGTCPLPSHLKCWAKRD